VDAYLKIDGVEGESTHKDHKDWLDTTAVSIGSPSTGAAARKVTFTPFTITRKIDKASARIAQASATGAHLPKVVIELTAENDHAVVWRVVLEDVVVTSYRALPPPNAKVAPMHEELTLTHAGVELWSRAVLPNGALGQWTKRDFAASRHELPVSVGGAAAAPRPPAAR
jgi:type VI secretion system secreted protein Hcp